MVAYCCKPQQYGWWRTTTYFMVDMRLEDVRGSARLLVVSSKGGNGSVRCSFLARLLYPRESEKGVGLTGMINRNTE